MNRLALSAALAGCYAGGPAPQQSSLAIVFEGRPPPTACGVGRSIGDVAFDAQGVGYAALVPFATMRTCGTIIDVQRVDSEIWRFDTSGSQMIGTGGRSDGFNNLPKIGVAPSGQTRWAFTPVTSDFSIELDGQPGVDVGPADNMHIQQATGTIVDDNGDVYVSSGVDIADAVDQPDYPSAGNHGSQVGAVTYTFTRLRTGETTATKIMTNTVNNQPDAPHFFCDLGKQCIAQNTTAVYFVGFSDGPAFIGRIDKSDITTQHTVVPIINLTTATSVSGFDVDDHYVAWATTTNYGQLDPAGTVAECEIYRQDLAGGNAVKLFASTTFACRDVAIDGEDVYFTIVSVQSERGETFPRFLHGDAVARVIAPNTIESLDLGVTGVEAGPRRIYVRGELMYLVDPMAVIRLDKAALDGRHDRDPT